MELSFFIPGQPKGQPRQRHGAFKRRDGSIGSRNYNGGEADDWIALISAEARKYRPDAPIQGGVRIDIDFVFTRPKCHFNKRGALTKSAPVHHTKKPDRDNLDKCVLDMLTKLGFWSDDSQAVAGEPRKRWAEGNEPQGAYVLIRALEPQKTEATE